MPATTPTTSASPSTRAWERSRFRPSSRNSGNQRMGGDGALSDFGSMSAGSLRTVWYKHDGGADPCRLVKPLKIPQEKELLVPTLCVGTHVRTLCVPDTFAAPLVASA